MSCISTFLTHPVLARSLYSSMFLKSPTIYGVSEGKRKVFEEAGRERTLVLKFFHRNSFLKQFYNIPIQWPILPSLSSTCDCLLSQQESVSPSRATTAALDMTGFTQWVSSFSFFFSFQVNTLISFYCKLGCSGADELLKENLNQDSSFIFLFLLFCFVSSSTEEYGC